MSLEVFTAAWADALCAALGASDDYRRSARSWEGALVLEMSAGAPDGDDDVDSNGDGDGDEKRSVLLDLWHGECRGARVVEAEEADRAPFVIGARPAAWQRVLAGELEPILALMSGQLSLRRGSLAALVPYTAASQALVRAAASLESHFPS